MFDFQSLVQNELARARKLHPEQQPSLHEGYAVLLEEVDEFWDEVKKKSTQREPVKLLEELVQIGAMAQRCAEDAGLLGVGPLSGVRYVFEDLDR